MRSERLLLVKDGAIASRPVKIDFVHEGAFAFTALPDDQWAVLVSHSQPLHDGELVVVNASIAMRDGDRVAPMLQDGKPAEQRGGNGAPRTTKAAAHGEAAP